MHRDIICIARLCVDTLPSRLRNSEILFWLCQKIFKLPKTLLNFRKLYENGQIKDIESYYLQGSEKTLKRMTDTTDINSRHLKMIIQLYKSANPKKALDVGSGTGYLLKKMKKINSRCELMGIDYCAPKKCTKEIKFIEGDIIKSLKKIEENAYEFVTCCHVIEHLSLPNETIKELRRVCSGHLIIICPLEKKYRWGMNYHINFFETKEIFLKLIKQTKESNTKKFPCTLTLKRLGDIMYVEY